LFHQETTIVERPVEEAWGFMTDLANTPKWDPGVLEVKQTSEGPVGVGTTIQSRHPKDRVLNARAIEYEPNHKFTLEFTSGPVKGTRVSYSMEIVEGKTKLTRTFDLKFSGAYRLVGPFVARGARREGGAEVNNVKRILESEAKTQPSTNEPYRIGLA
jgi:uncharacterized protein YndB with AHSA1/START domain